MAEGKNNQLLFYDNALLFQEDDHVDDPFLTESYQRSYFDDDPFLTESYQRSYFDESEDLGKKDALVDKAKLQKYLKCEGALHGLNRYINESFEGWEQADLHVGIFGASGSGKSSLINALRNVNDNDQNAANVDVEEVDCKPTPYKFPKQNRVILWDIPGIGTKLHPKDTSTLADMEISKFEVVVIVFCTRLTEIDLWLADESFKAGCSVLFVRTKIDHDVTDSSERNKSKDECLKEIRQKTIAKLNSHRFSSKTQEENIDLFLVSSRIRHLYDFQKLTISLETLLNDRATRIISQIKPIVLEMIEMEQKSNNERYFGRKLYAAVYGFLPLPVLETVLGGLSMEEIVKKSKGKFHLDDESVADIPSMLDESKEGVDEVLACGGKEGDGKLRREKTEDKTWGAFRKYSKYMIPLVGSVLSAVKEYETTEICISELSNELAKDLSVLVDIRLGNLQRDLTRISLN